VNVGILIFPGVEILDFTGPFETFSVATRVAQRDRRVHERAFDAFFVSETTNVVSARYDFLVKPHFGFDDHPLIDLLIIPGGIVDQPHGALARDREGHEGIRKEDRVPKRQDRQLGWNVERPIAEGDVLALEVLELIAHGDLTLSGQLVIWLPGL